MNIVQKLLGNWQHLICVRLIIMAYYFQILELKMLCNVCKLKFETHTDLKMHMITHKGKYISLNYDNKEYPYACTFDRCCYMARNKKQMKAHDRTHTGEK